MLFFSGCMAAKREGAPPPRLTASPPPSSNYTFHSPDHEAPIRSFEQISTLPSEEFDLAEALLALAAEPGRAEFQSESRSAQDAPGYR